MIKTDTDRYHGGWLNDEIAALLSLCLGIRVKSGGSTRRFEPEGDPRGRPEHYSMHLNPVLLRKSFRSHPVLPSALGSHCLNDAIHLQKFTEISPDDAMALIRAARLYQDAMWIAESEPSLAWLLLVSSVETAADYWRKEKETPIERMRASKPELEALLIQNCSENVVSQVAELMANFMGATRKFIDFLLTFLPSPPKNRPAQFIQVSWEETNLQKALTKIYSWRSIALHGGTPFPLPMCEPPYFHEGRYAENQGLGVPFC